MIKERRASSSDGQHEGAAPRTNHSHHHPPPPCSPSQVSQTLLIQTGCTGCVCVSSLDQLHGCGLLTRHGLLNDPCAFSNKCIHFKVESM